MSKIVRIIACVLLVSTQAIVFQFTTAYADVDSESDPTSRTKQWETFLKLKVGNQRVVDGKSRSFASETSAHPTVIVVKSSETNTQPELVFNIPKSNFYTITLDHGVAEAENILKLEQSVEKFSPNVLVILGEEQSSLNVKKVVARIMRNSSLLKLRIEDNQLILTQATYYSATGKVNFWAAGNPDLSADSSEK